MPVAWFLASAGRRRPQALSAFEPPGERDLPPFNQLPDRRSAGRPTVGPRQTRGPRRFDVGADWLPHGRPTYAYLGKKVQKLEFSTCSCRFPAESEPNQSWVRSCLRLGPAASELGRELRQELGRELRQRRSSAIVRSVSRLPFTRRVVAIDSRQA